MIAQGLPFELCAWITKEIAQALAAVHGQGLLHRDVKPQNIFIAQNGEVKLGDLGLAIACNEVSTNLAGTPAYFSPELILGQKLSPRSDLFSLGAVLYEMLTAAPPFADHTTSAILHRIANLEPTPPEKLRPEIPYELAALCRKLLAKNPGERCRDAEEVKAALRQFEQQYELRLSAKNLAQFLEQPEAYARAKFPPAGSVDRHFSFSKPPAISSGTNRRIFSKRRFLPLMFVAAAWCGFIFMNFENRAEENPPAPGTQSLHEPNGANAEPITVKKEAEILPRPAKEIPAETLSPVAKIAEREPGLISAPAATPRKSLPEISRTLPSVLLRSEPRAKVFVENDSLGLTPVRWTPARADQVYELRFVSPALPQVSKLVTQSIIESDTFALNLWREFAYLEIAVNPWGEIWIDGKAIDTTPLAKPLALAPGLHELDIRHPQLGTHRQRLVLVKGDTLRKVVNLFAP